MAFANFLNKVAGQPESYHLKGEYRFGRTLGAGTFGIVKSATHLPSKEEVAIKIVLKKTIAGNEQMILDELAMLQQLDHPHIVKFRAWFESKEKYYIVTQLATGGELFERICECGKYTEKDGVSTIKEILDAIVYLHDRDIVHRDLKPENLLYLTPEKDSSLVLADFGIAKNLKNGQKLTTMAGSFGYAAPEILLGSGHGKPCDIWSLGVITYTILSGYSPFRAETVDDFLTEVEDCKFLVFHDRYWGAMSVEAKNFISAMLDPNPENRPTAQELLVHPWIADEKAANATQNLLPNIRAGFNAKLKLRKGIEAVLLSNRIAALKMDELEEGEDGEITLTLAQRLAGLTFKATSPASPTSPTAKSPKSPALNAAAFREVVRVAQRNKELLKEDSTAEAEIATKD